MNRKEIKTLVLAKVCSLICMVIDIQRVKIKEEKQYSVAYTTTAQSSDLTLQLQEIGLVLLI
jgi:hypothetical protein